MSDWNVIHAFSIRPDECAVQTDDVCFFPIKVCESVARNLKAAVESEKAFSGICCRVVETSAW